MLYHPPGTVLVKDSLYIDQFEIRNAGWKEYIRSTLNNQTDSSYDIYPDSTVSLNIRNIGKISMEEYFTDSKYDDYPVVGINYEQAVKFC
jgi:formylglycine-generating enzyme required for sulfatase activity